MAVVVTKASAITNRDATPKVDNNANIAKGALKEFVGTVEGANGDSINSTYLFGTVPSNARMSQILLSNDAIGVSGAMDVGVYHTTADGGAVVDQDHFASAVDLTAAHVNLDVTHEADAADAGTGFGLQDVEKMLWQSLGLASDPCSYFDIVGTLTTALGGAGTLSVHGKYAE